MHTLGHIFKLMSGSALASPYLLRRRILLQNGYWVTKPKKGGIHRLLCRIRMDLKKWKTFCMAKEIINQAVAAYRM